MHRNSTKECVVMKYIEYNPSTGIESLTSFNWAILEKWKSTAPLI